MESFSKPGFVQSRLTRNMAPGVRLALQIHPSNHHCPKRTNEIFFRTSILGRESKEQPNILVECNPMMLIC